METLTIETYTFAELSEAAKETAIEHERDNRINGGDVPWQEEIMDSLRALFDTIADVSLINHDIGYRGNGLRLIFDYDETREFTGRRAFAWLENNLLWLLRIPYTEKGAGSYHSMAAVIVPV